MSSFISGVANPNTEATVEARVEALRAKAEIKAEVLRVRKLLREGIGLNDITTFLDKEKYFPITPINLPSGSPIPEGFTLYPHLGEKPNLINIIGQKPNMRLPNKGKKGDLFYK